MLWYFHPFLQPGSLASVTQKLWSLECRQRREAGALQLPASGLDDHNASTPAACFAAKSGLPLYSLIGLSALSKRKKALFIRFASDLRGGGERQDKQT